MPSTYSPGLRIELIGAGDQAGTWGSSTNLNLGTLIEQSISGSASVSVTSANQALVALNGTSDQARQATIRLSTTTAAPFNVYAPPSAKQYTIFNSSAYVATVFNSTVLNNTTAAGTGVAIPAGKTVTVMTDGTDFLSQNTHLPGVTTAATAAPGTNTTQIATTSFVNNVASALGTMSTQNANSVSITGGSVLNVTVTGALVGAYPVGSIYMNVNNGTNPSSLLGFGSWTALSQGRMLLGAGGAFGIGAQGGSNTSTLSTENLPSHTHTANVNDPGHAHLGGYQSGGQNTGSASLPAVAPVGTATNLAFTGISVSNSNTGSNAAFNTISPFLVVYMWVRTA